MLKGLSILFLLICFFQAFNSPEGGTSFAELPVFSISATGDSPDRPEKKTTPQTIPAHTAADFEKEDTGVENDFINHAGLPSPHSNYNALSNSSTGKASFRMKDQLHADIQTPPPDDQLIA